MHECSKEDFLGRVAEFMESAKGTRVLQWSMVGVIVVQVGVFLVLWGSLTTTVNKNTDFLWNNMFPQTTTNTRNIDKILSRLDFVTIVTGETIKDLKEVK
jgi:hypothetical protein